MIPAEINKLSVRPFPFKDEGAKGYLLRVANANGLDQIGYRMVSGKDPTEHQLRALLGRDDQAFWENHPESTFRNDHASKQNVIWNWRNRKCCSVCLNEKQYWRVEWELRCFTTCPTHGTKLIDRCPCCTKPLAWKSHYLTHCDCGYDLRLTAMKPAGTNDIQLAQTYRALLGFSTVPKPMERVSHLTPYGLYLLIQYLGKLGTENPIDIRATDSLLDDIDPIVSHAAIALGDWPESYHRILKSYCDEKPPASDSISMPATFGKAYTVLYRGLKDEQFTFVRREFEKYLQENWRWSMCNRNKRLSAETRSGGMWMPAAQAAKRLRVGRSYISEQVTLGKLDARAFLTTKGRTHLVVFIKDVEQEQIERENNLSLLEAANALGISDTRVIELAKAKIIQVPVRVAKPYTGKWNIPRGELEKLLELGQTAPEVTEYNVKKGVSLNNLLKSGLRGVSALADLIMEICVGQITVNERIAGLTGLSGWVVRKDQYHDWLERQTGLEEISYSIQKVAAALRIKEEVAYSLVKKGLLQAQSDVRNGRTITKILGDEIVRFKKRYAFNSHLAQELGTSPRTLMNQFESMGVCPYLPIGKGEFRQTIFERTQTFESCWDSIVNNRPKEIDDCDETYPMLGSDIVHYHGVKNDR